MSLHINLDTYHKGGEKFMPNIAMAKGVIRGMFASVAPATAASLDSARDVANDVKNISRRININMQQNLKQIDKSRPGRHAIALFQAAKDAINSDDYDLDQANDSMYDDYEDYESDFTLDDMDEDQRAETSPEELMLRGNRGIAKTVIRASTAQLEGMDAISKKVLRGTLRGFEATAQSVNATILHSTNILSAQIGETNTKLDTINRNITALIEYQNENTTRYYEKNLELMEGMITSMNNFADMSRGKGARSLRNFDVTHGFNFKEYLDRVIKGVKNSAMVSGVGLINTMKDMAQFTPEGPAEMIGSFLPMVLGMIPILGPMLNQKIGKLTKVDNRVTRYMDETLKTIGDKLGTNMLASLLGLDALGNQRRTNYGIDMSAYMKEQIPWNGKAQKALTEVIPELLTSIDAGVNRTEKRYYDYDQGYFKSRSEIEKDFSDQLNTSISLEFSSLLDSLGRKFDNSGKTAEEIEKAKKDISDVVYKRIYNNGDLKTARQEMSDILEGMNLSASEYSSAFNGIEKSLNEIAENMAELYAKIGSTDSVYRTINNRSGRSSMESVGKDYYRILKEERVAGGNNLFRASIASDVQQTMDYIEAAMKADFPDFKLNTDYKQYINAAVRAGEADYEILRKIKNTYGKENIKDVVMKWWAKIRGKEYTPTPQVEEDELDADFGTAGNRLDQSILKTIYGVKNNYEDLGNTKPMEALKKLKADKAKKKAEQETASIAASSQRSEMNGEEAGAKAKEAKRKEGKSFVPPIEGAPSDNNVEAAKENILTEAAKPFDDIMNSDESDLQKSEKERENAAAAINDIADGKRGGIRGLIDTAILAMGNMVSSFTSFGARLFGKEGMIKNFFKSDTFKKGLESAKAYLFDEEKGIFKDQVKFFKEKGKEYWGKTKEKLVDAYDWVYDKYSISKYGEDYTTNEEWQNSKMMQRFNLKANLAKKAEEKAKNLEEGKSSTPEVEPSEELKSSTQEIETASEELKSSVKEVIAEVPEKLKSSVQEIADAASGVAENITDSGKAFVENVIGTDETPEDIKKELVKEGKSVGAKFKKLIPGIGAAAIIGGGVGVLNGLGGASILGSMFLPTGLIGGAIVGSGLMILSHTEAIKSLLFGKKLDPNDQNSERAGGLISKDLSAKFKKMIPYAVGGAVAGVAKNLITAPFTGGGGLGLLGMQLLPGGVLGGAIMGMGVGLLKNTELFQDILYGKKNENGERSGTWLTKSFGKMNTKMGNASKYIKNALKGGAVGTVSGATLASMGALPAAVSMGPIGMGIAGLGLGIAATTDKFQTWLFGTEELDDEGNPIGRKGGILERVKNLINANMVEPMAAAFKKNMLDLVDWTKDKITMPFRTAFGPILDSIVGIKDNVVQFVEDKFEDIGTTITSVLKKTISTLASPVTWLMGKLGHTILSAGKFGIEAALTPLSLGLNALNVLTMGKRRKDYKAYRKAYLAQEEKGGMMGALSEYWEAQRRDGKSIGIFDMLSDTLNAYTGKGPIEEQFYEGYIAQMDEEGQNSLGWRNVRKERKQLRKDRKARRDDYNKWAKINKYGRSLANEYGGREIELTPAMFDKVKAKFVGMGIDAEDINTSSDIMDLIYRPSQFKKKLENKGAEPVGEGGVKLELTEEEKAHMDKTEKHQSFVEQYLAGIYDLGKVFAEQSIYNRERTTYEQDRRRDTTRLKKKLKGLYGTAIWGDTRKINLKDPKLREYDIENITTEDLKEYAVSEYGAKGDFTGWLESVGRKMSPDDRRLRYSAADIWKSSTHEPPSDKPVDEGKSSTESPTNNAPVDVGKSAVLALPEKSSATENVQEEMLTELKQQRELQEASLEVSSGGEITADDVKKNGFKDFGKKITSKFSFAGALTDIFNKKRRQDKLDAAAAKEAEEQAQATALGDNPDEENPEENKENATINGTAEKKQSIFGQIASKIFGGAIGIGSKIVSNPLVKGVMKFGAVAIPAILGLSVFDMIRPGSTEKIGAAIDNFNKSVDDGSFFDKVKEKVTNGITWIQDTIKSFFGESKLGAAMKGVFENVGAVVTQTIPKVIEGAIERLPAVITGITDWITENGAALVNSIGDVITTVGPPLVSALIDTMPTLIYQLGIRAPLSIGTTVLKKIAGGLLQALGFKDPWADENTKKENVTINELDSGKNAIATGTREITAEEAQQMQAAGYGDELIVGDDGKIYAKTYSQGGDNVVGFTDDGKAITQGNTSLRQSTEKFGINALASAARAGAGGGAFAKTVSWLGKHGYALTKPIRMATGATGWVLNKGGALLSKVPFFKTAGKITQGTGAVLQTISNPVENVGAVVDTAKTAVAKITSSSKIASKASETAATSVGKLFSRITNMIKGLADNKVLKRIVDSFKGLANAKVQPLKWLCDFLNSIVKSLSAKCKGEFATQMTKKISEGLTKAGTTSVPLLTVVMASWGFGTGALEAGNLFGVSDPDWIMVFISSLMKGLLSISFGCIFDLLFELAHTFLGLDIKEDIAIGLYKMITANTPEKYEELMNARENQEIERQVYNTLNGTNLDSDAYNDIANKTVINKITSTIKNGFYSLTGQRDKIAPSTKDVTNAVNALRRQGYSDDTISRMTADEIRQKAGIAYGSGPYNAGRIVYGNPYAQGNSSWANIPIGTFANGKTATMSTGGCGPTALSAVANMLGKPLSPAQVGIYASNNGYITYGGANSMLFTEGASRLGMQGTHIRKSDVETAIDNGLPTIISGKSSGPFTSAGHVVVARGTDGKGNINILDPTDGKVKTYSKSQIKSGMNDAWAYNVGYGPALASAFTPEIDPRVAGSMPVSTGMIPGAASAGLNTSKTAPSTSSVTAPFRTGSPIANTIESWNNSPLKAKGAITKQNDKAMRAAGLVEDDTYDDSADNGGWVSDAYTSNPDDTSIIETNSDGVTIDYTQDLRDTLNSEPTSLGGLIGGFKKFGNMIQALWGVIKGDGDFTTLYNQLAANDEKNKGITAGASVGNDAFITYDSADGTQQQNIWKFLRGQGLSQYATAGVMGCWHEESSNRADRVEGDYIAEARKLGVNKILESNTTLDNYTENILFPYYARNNMTVNKASYRSTKNGHWYPGIGVAQWTGDRADNLYKYAKANGGDWRDLNYQLNFANKEMNERKLKNLLYNISSPEAAARTVLDHYEMYSGFGAKNPNMLKARQEAARKWYNTMKEYDNTLGFGCGPVGFGPADEPSNIAELMSGASAATDYLQTKLDDMGIGDLISVKSSNNDSSSGIDDTNSIRTSGASSGQMGVVNAMKSIYGKLKYTTEGGKQNPDKGTGSCASTVAWAYNKVLGIRPGDTVSDSAYMRSQLQSKDSRFTTIWQNHGKPITDNEIAKLQPGDIIYDNWDATKYDGTVKHTEMYIGNGQILTHGGPDPGPQSRTFNDYRKAHTMLIRRYNGFMGDSTGFGIGPNKKNTFDMGNEFYNALNDTKNMKLGHEGGGNNRTVGYGSGNDVSGLEDRLDKIFNLVTEWYLMEKKHFKPTGFGGGVTNNTVVNAPTNVNAINGKTSETKPKANTQFNSNLDKLAQKHNSFARMFKTSI